MLCPREMGNGIPAGCSFSRVFLAMPHFSGHHRCHLFSCCLLRPKKQLKSSVQSYPKVLNTNCVRTVAYQEFVAYHNLDNASFLLLPCMWLRRHNYGLPLTSGPRRGSCPKKGYPNIDPQINRPYYWDPPKWHPLFWETPNPKLSISPLVPKMVSLIWGNPQDSSLSETDKPCFIPSPNY